MGWSIDDRGAAYRDAVVSTAAHVRSMISEVSERDLISFLMMFPIAVIEDMRRVPVSVAIHASLFASRVSENVDSYVGSLSAGDARPLRGLLARLGYTNIMAISEALRNESITASMIAADASSARPQVTTATGTQLPPQGTTAGGSYASPFEAKPNAGAGSPGSQSTTTPPATVQGGGAATAGSSGPGQGTPTAPGTPGTSGTSVAGTPGSETNDGGASVEDLQLPQSNPLSDTSYRVSPKTVEGVSYNEVQFLESQGI